MFSPRQCLLMLPGRGHFRPGTIFPRFFAMQSKGLKVDELSLQTFAMYSRPLFRDASYLESPDLWKTPAI